MKKSLLKRATSFVLASAVAVSAAVSAFAASSITIYPGTNSKKGATENNRYVAYQIFKGGVVGVAGVDDTHDHVDGSKDDPNPISIDDFKDAVAGGNKKLQAYFGNYQPDDELNEDLLNAAYELYEAEYWNDIHSMQDINWGSALVGPSTGNITYTDSATGTVYDPIPVYDYSNVKNLLLELANTNFTGAETKLTVANDGTITKNGTEYTAESKPENADDYQWAFIEIYNKLYPSTIPIVSPGPSQNEDAYNAEVELAQAADKAYKTAAREVAKVLSGDYEYVSAIVASTNEKVKEPIGAPATTAVLQKFAKVVQGKVIPGSGTAAEWNNTNEPNEEDNGTAWVIEGLDEGYYLVADEKTSIGEADSRAPYFLDVLDGQNIEVHLKSDAPTVDKTISAVNGSSDNVKDSDLGEDKTAIANIGDTITYTLKGSFPENLDDFNKSYYYRFSDTLDKSLTYVENSVDITLYLTKNDGTTVVVPIVRDGNTFNYGYAWQGAHEDKFSISARPLEYDSSLGVNEESYANDKITTGKDTDDGKTRLMITFTDLIELLKSIQTYNDPRVVLSDIDWTNSYMAVYYDVILNENAVVGTPGNNNTVKLIYTNDPNSGYDSDDDPGDPGNPVDPDDPPPEDTTTTTESKTTVYTFEIDIDKTDLNTTPVAGAGFTVTNNDGDVAVFVSTADGKYTFVGWAHKAADFHAPEEPDESADYSDFVEVNGTAVVDLAKFKANHADELKAILGETAAQTAVLRHEVFTNAEGKLFIKGLTAGRYIFEETTAPDNYSPVEKFYVELVAEVVDATLPDASTSDKFTGALENDGEKKYVTGEKAETQTTVVRDNFVNGKMTIGVIDPFETTDLPGTGGMGVYFYYIAGGALVLLAGAALFLTRKKSGKKS